MIKLKVLSSVLSLAVLCSAPIANAESKVVGQLVANPSAIINAGAAQQRVGSQATAYIQGDTITTGSDASATVSLSSGSAKLVVAPNTVMAVINAAGTEFSLSQGAFNVQAKEGQTVTVDTSVGAFDLVSSSSLNAIASFQSGEFAVVSKKGLLTVTSQDGAVLSIDAGNAYVYNDKGAASLNVQIATPAATTAGAGAGLGTAIGVGVGVGAVGLGISQSASDGGDAAEAAEEAALEEAAASPI